MKKKCSILLKPQSQTLPIWNIDHVMYMITSNSNNFNYRKISEGKIISRYCKFCSVYITKISSSVFEELNSLVVKKNNTRNMTV